MKMEAFENSDEKSVIYHLFPSAVLAFLVWMIKCIKSMHFQMKTNKCGQVKKQKQKCKSTRFCFVFFKTKTETFGNTLVQPGP